MTTDIIRPIDTPSADAERAAAYCAFAIRGRWSDRDKLIFEFERKDGSVDTFTCAEMRAASWWRSLSPQEAAAIEVNLQFDPYAAGLQAGANALKDLMQRLEKKADADLKEHYELHPEEDGCDARDYRTMSSMVQTAIEDNMHHQDPAHREGFIRAMTDLLSVTAEGCGISDDWDPIRATAAAFAGERPIPQRAGCELVA